MRNQVQELAREIDVIERDPRHAELLAQNLGDLGFAHQTGLDQQRSDASPVFLLEGQNVLQLRTGNDVGLDEELSQPDARRDHILEA